MKEENLENLKSCRGPYLDIDLIYIHVTKNQIYTVSCDPVPFNRKNEYDISCQYVKRPEQTFVIGLWQSIQQNRGKEDPNENGNFSKWKENFPAHEWNNLEWHSGLRLQIFKMKEIVSLQDGICQNFKFKSVLFYSIYGDRLFKKWKNYPLPHTNFLCFHKIYWFFNYIQ